MIHMQTQYMINGRREGCISPMDRGFAYGDGVFRTLPVRHGIPHCWLMHYARLSQDCHRLGIVCPSARLLLSEVEALCHDVTACVIKIVITRGESGRGYAVPALAQPTRVLVMSGLPEYAERHASEGVDMHVCQTRLAIQPQLAGIKHLNRLENVLARMEWTDASIAEGLMLDVEGCVIEGTMSNLFVRHGEVFSTPDLSRSGVAGVTRDRVIAMLGQRGHPVQIRRFLLDEVLSADEVFVCNSLIGAWQVRSMSGKQWEKQPLTAELRCELESDNALDI